VGKSIHLNDINCLHKGKSREVFLCPFDISAGKDLSFDLIWIQL